MCVAGRGRGVGEEGGSRERWESHLLRVGVRWGCCLGLFQPRQHLEQGEGRIKARGVMGYN